MLNCQVYALIRAEKGDNSRSYLEGRNWIYEVYFPWKKLVFFVDGSIEDDREDSVADLIFIKARALWVIPFNEPGNHAKEKSG